MRRRVRLEECARAALRRLVAVCLVALVVIVAAPAPGDAQDALSRAATELDEARRLFEALDYERAVPALDRAIAVYETLANVQPQARPGLASAYEMRGRARFGLGDTVGAETDFRALLGIAPGFSFSGQVSPRVVALLDEVRRATLGMLLLTVEPEDAAVEVNGETFDPGVPVPLRAGEYTVKASRVGYRPAEEPVTIVAGDTANFRLMLERVAATLVLVTSPPGAEVIVDGISRGTTVAGALPAAYAEVPSQLGVAPEDVSQPMVVSDLGPGAHVVQVTRACHVAEERRFVVEALADYRVDPVRLKPAVATLAVESAPAGAAVFVDGEPRGTAPVTLEDVCAGSRLVELRGAQGRFARRLDVRTGDQVAVSGTLKPAFALLSAGIGVSTTGVTDVRSAVERALAHSQQVTLFVPAERQLAEAFKGQPQPAEWLAFDAGRRPLGAAATVSATARRDLSAKLGRELGVQGVAAVSQPAAGSPELVVSLLAVGAGEPDVVAFVPERVDSVSRAIARFDYVPPVTRASIGALVVDVLDAGGLVVARVEAGSGAAKLGLATGDTIKTADGQPVASVDALNRLLQAKGPGATIALQVTARDGLAGKSLQVPIVATPRVISAGDQTLLFNPLAVALRTRLGTATPAEQPIVRLNLAVALLRLGDAAGAKEHLEALELPATGDISMGTRHYLLGLALEQLGDTAGAQRAFQAAAATQALLTEDGPPVRLLAEQKLRAMAAPTSN
jgi:hypothetical protein